MEWKNIGMGQEDMQFLEGRGFTLDEVMRTFGIPAGKYKENATEANAKVANETFQSETLWPKLVAVAAKLTHTLIGPAYGEDYAVEFEDIRPEDRRIWLDEVTTVMAGTMGNGGTREPVLTRDEVREKYFKLEKFPEEEEPEIPAQLQPFAGQQPPPPDEEEPDEDEEPVPEKSAADDRDRWQRKALGALKRGKSVDVTFETVAIPAHDRLAIRAALADAETAEEVKAAFCGPFCAGHDWEGYP